MYLLILGFLLALFCGKDAIKVSKETLIVILLSTLGAVLIVVLVKSITPEGDTASRANHSPKPDSVTDERAQKYYGQSAREEMREYLKRNGTLHPSEADVNFALKLNERLEYHGERERTHPEEYK